MKLIRWEEWTSHIQLLACMVQYYPIWRSMNVSSLIFHSEAAALFPWSWLGSEEGCLPVTESFPCRSWDVQVWFAHITICWSKRHGNSLNPTAVTFSNFEEVNVSLALRSYELYPPYGWKALSTKQRKNRFLKKIFVNWRYGKSGKCWGQRKSGWCD